MIDRIIELSIRYRWWLVAGGIVWGVAGTLAVFFTPIDAIPDLSETQIILYAEWAGHGPRDVQQSITMPLSAQLRGVAGIRTVRGSSEANFSLIHVIFDDGIAIRDARHRMEDRLAKFTADLPAGVQPRLAPDAPATGQVFWYTVEAEGRDLEELRSIQDQLIRDRLAEIPGVAEVASVGGFHSELQIALRPDDVAAFGLTVAEVVHQVGSAIAGRNESAVATLQEIAIQTADGRSLSLSQLADIRRSPALRYGMLEKDGNEVVGGVVLMRHGTDPLRVIQRVRASIDELGTNLPTGVRIVTAYDRTPLIRGATWTVASALFEAMLTAGVCVVVVTRHWRASLVVVLTLPLAVLSAFAVLWLARWLGWLDVQINLMSLAGITISIGVLVDSSIVMAENVMHRLHDQFGDELVQGDVSESVIAACRSVGRPIFFSVLIMLLSFLPVFALEGMEGKMFRPLAITKSLALAGAAVLAITFVPALCVLLIRGRMIAERQSWLVRSVIDVYQPILRFSLQCPLPLFFLLAATLLAGAAPLGDQRIYLAAVALVLAGIWVAARSDWSRWVGIVASLGIALILESKMAPLEREFLTPLDEGTAMDMPITIPGISSGQAIDDLKARNMVLCRYPEVEMVMGKVGRADTATDPAPLDMIETMVSFRPREFWPRRHLTETDARSALAWMWDQLVQKGLCAAPHDHVEQDARLNDALTAVLGPFHAVLREYAYQRNQECIGEAAQMCLQRLAKDVMGTSGAAEIAAAVSKIPPQLVSRFADDWPGDTVPEIARQMLGAKDMINRQGPASNTPSTSILNADMFARWRRLVNAERRRVWQQHTRQLNSELNQRSAPTLAFLALRHLLTSSDVRDAGLRQEVARLRSYQQVSVRSSRRSHHGIVEPSRPDVDPTPAFDALTADCSKHMSQRLALRASLRSEIAGFGGEMDTAVSMPGWTNVWTMPIQNRVDMLATGVNTTVGIRVLGPSLDAVVDASERIAEVVRQVPGASSVVADPVRGKQELIVRWNRERASALGVDSVGAQATVDAALTGIVVAESNAATRRDSVRVLLAADWRSDTDRLRRLPLVARQSDSTAFFSLGQIANVEYQEVPASLKSENGQSRNYVRLNVRGRDDTEFVREAQQVVANRVTLPPGVTVEWTGEFEQQQRAQQRLRIMLPAVLLVIFAVLWMTYRDLADATLMLLAVPGALAGGVILQWALGYKLSVTVAVGYIACLGMATSTGIIMLVYLREAVENAGGLGGLSLEGLRTAVLHGAVHRLRPKLLTEATTILGLAPMLWATGIGAEVIRPMAAPVLGGILVADEVIDLLLPVLFFWVRRRRWERLQTNDNVTQDFPAEESTIRKDPQDALISPLG